jgi:hypothetical protein
MQLDEALKRELAVKASCDPRTIQRVYDGERVRGLAGRRAKAALAEAGFLGETGREMSEGGGK